MKAKIDQNQTEKNDNIFENKNEPDHKFNEIECLDKNLNEEKNSEMVKNQDSLSINKENTVNIKRLKINNSDNDKIQNNDKTQNDYQRITISEFKINHKIIKNKNIFIVADLINDIEYSVNDQKEKTTLLKNIINESIDTFNNLVSSKFDKHTEIKLINISKIIISNDDLLRIFLEISTHEALKFVLKNNNYKKKIFANYENLLIECIMNKENINDYILVLKDLSLIRPMLILMNLRFCDIDPGFIKSNIFKYVSNLNYEIVLNALEIIFKGKNSNILEINSYSDDLIKIFMKRAILDDIGMMILYILGIRVHELSPDIFYIDPVIFSSHFKIIEPNFQMVLALAKEIKRYKFPESVFENNASIKDDYMYDRERVSSKTKNFITKPEKFRFKPSAEKMINIFREVKYEEKQVTELITMILDTLDIEEIGKRNKIIFIRILKLFQCDKNFFYRISELIANEKNIEVVLELIEVLKNSKYKHLIEDMRYDQNLKRLLLRIYPINMGDKEFYKSLLNEFKGLSEVMVLLEYYHLETVFLLS
ncbi:hypothetical protein DMUE_1498 [Dictyocoela muelleri]|nr:hypothetical protein DMUE_1498 [Dictyocoela muelleri]